MKAIDCTTSGGVVRLCLLSAVLLFMLAVVIIKRKSIKAADRFSMVFLMLAVLCRMGYQFFSIITMKWLELEPDSAVKMMQLRKNVSLWLVAFEVAFLTCSLVVAYWSLRKRRGNGSNDVQGPRDP